MFKLNESDNTTEMKPAARYPHHTEDCKLSRLLRKSNENRKIVLIHTIT